MIVPISESDEHVTDAELEVGGWLGGLAQESVKLEPCWEATTTFSTVPLRNQGQCRRTTSGIDRARPRPRDQPKDSSISRS